MFPIVILLLFTFVSPFQTAEDIASKVEAELHSFRSLQAHFEHIYYSSTISTPLKEKGKFYYRESGQMKWKYEEPEEKIFLYENGLLQSYYPEDNQLIRNSLSEEEYDSEFLSLFVGKKRLLDRYTIEFSPFPTDNSKSHQLKLIPKDEESDSYILLEISKKTWLIQKVISFDWAGNKSEFHFSQVKTNIAFPKDLFQLKLPPDVEIIEK